MPGRDVGLLQKKRSVQDAVSVPVPFAWEKKKERSSVPGDGSVVRKRETEAAEGRLWSEGVVKVC